MCIRKDRQRKNEGTRLFIKGSVPGGGDVDDGIRYAGERVVIALRKWGEKGERYMIRQRKKTINNVKEEG